MLYGVYINTQPKSYSRMGIVACIITLMDPISPEISHILITLYVILGIRAMRCTDSQNSSRARVPKQAILARGCDFWSPHHWKPVCIVYSGDALCRSRPCCCGGFKLRALLFWTAPNENEAMEKFHATAANETENPPHRTRLRRRSPEPAQWRAK